VNDELADTQSVISVYPNPALGSVVIRQAPANESTIFNVRGQKVITLHSNNKSDSGYEFHWDLRDQNGCACPQGVYIIRSSSSTSKLLNLRK
jgi:hypothetical protein